ncbi:MAG: YqaE/Pmp3 family membrane protein [Fulvivirga sp.]|nr:YqaE/Pmp3 family membrane protein [Fulvivirga sp.]
MKNLSNYLLLCLMLFFGAMACTPKYSAHFNKSDNFYKPAVEPGEKDLANSMEEPTTVKKMEVEPLMASKERMVPTDEAPKINPRAKELLEAYKAETERIREKNLPEKVERRAIKKEKKKLKKKFKKEIKEEIKALKKQNASDDYVLMMLLAFLIPPLGVGLTYGITAEFWISLILTLIFWLPGAIYSLIVVHNYYR